MAAPASCAMKIAALSSCMMMISAAYAMKYTVGGDAGWVLGDDLQKWAAEYTFYVGDELYFHYKRSESSVLLVTEEDYKDCNIDKEVASDEGKGDMAMTLLTAETYYFISGHADQCKEGLRLEVPVLEAPTTSAGGLQPGGTGSSPGSSSASPDIPSSPVVLSPPRSVNTPYSTSRPNAASPSSLTTTSTLFCIALALAFAYLLTL